MKKIVLAYSGGLDTTCAVHWLAENGYSVICFMADLGQGLDIAALKQRALSAGADKVYVKDLRDEFVQDFVIPALKANAVYEGKYLLATALGRPLIAKHFLAGRGEAEYGFGNHPEFIDIACVGGIRVERMSGFEMIGLVEELTWRGLWVILAFHDINGVRLSVQSEDFLLLLNYLKRNEKTIWTAPIRDVAQKIIDQKT